MRFPRATRPLRDIRRTSPDHRHELVLNGKLDRVFPVSWHGVREGFAQLGMSSRAANRSDFAAVYFGSTARLALMEGDIEAAVDAITAQADILSLLVSPQKAQAAMGPLSAEIDQAANARWERDPAVVLAHARLVVEQARMMIRAGELDEAKRVLAAEWSRCQSPLNRRALSWLATTLAWTLRATTDVDGVLQAGKLALELAESENAAWETARALTVIGATMYDLGELTHAENAFRGAANVLPNGKYHEDRWLIFERLADVFKASGRLQDAQSALTDAARAADEGCFGAWAERTRRQLFEVALQIKEAAFGPHHPEVARALTDLGNYLRELGEDLEDARDRLQRALQIYEAAGPADSPDIARTLEDLARVLHELGDHQGARDRQQRALQIYEAAGPADSPDIARTLEDLARVLHELGDLEGMHECLEHVRRITAQRSQEKELLKKASPQYGSRHGQR